MLIAIQDADRVLLANAPQNVIYNIIIKNMFKSPDDITTFESSLNKSGGENKLITLVKAMKATTESKEKLDLNKIIAEKVFVDENKELVTKTQEMQELIDTYSQKFAKMEQDRKQVIEHQIRRVKLSTGKLVSNTNVPEAIGNFRFSFLSAVQP